jgi:hypothetical protein
MLTAMAAGALVYHRALSYFFSQDDFLGLARVNGLAPRLVQPWRYIANQAIWDVLRPFGAHNAFPHHLASLLAHLGCVAMVYALLARRLSRSGALVGATFFAVHPALFTALHWVSAVGDPLALLYGLIVLALMRRTDAWRWMTVPLFGLSLMAKESLLLLPVVAAAFHAWERAGTPADGASRPDRETPAGGRIASALIIDGPVLALAVVSIAYVIYFFAAAYGTYFLSSSSPGVGADHATRSPYALGWGANLWQNLFTYLGWTANFLLPTVRRVSDAVDPGVYLWAIGAIVLWLAGLASRRLRAGGWLLGGFTWLMFVLPVLPLKNHTYHYYLYAPLFGAAWCVGAAIDAMRSQAGRLVTDRTAPVERGDVPRAGGLTRAVAASTIATVGVVLLTLNGWLLVRKIETMPFVLSQLRADPIIDRARIAWNVRESLARYAQPPGDTLIFWSPIASALGPSGEPLAAPLPRETYWEHNVRDALLDGLAVRVMFPQVAAVRFVHEYQPTGSSARYAIYRPDGGLMVATSAAVDSFLDTKAQAR